jgi:hypothetical protein
VPRPSWCRRRCQQVDAWEFDNGELFCAGVRKANSRKCDTVRVCHIGRRKHITWDEFTPAEAVMYANLLTAVVGLITKSPEGSHCRTCADRNKCLVPQK